MIEDMTQTDEEVNCAVFVCDDAAIAPHVPFLTENVKKIFPHTCTML